MEDSLNLLSQHMSDVMILSNLAFDTYASIVKWLCHDNAMMFMMYNSIQNTVVGAQ